MNRSFIEESQAGIKISPQDNNYLGLNDRLVTLTGTLDEQMRAIELILSKLAEDAHYTQSMNAPFSYPGVSVFKIILLFVATCLPFLYVVDTSLCFSLTSKLCGTGPWYSLKL